MSKETGKHGFKIGDLAVCNSAGPNMKEAITEGQMYTVKDFAGNRLIRILSDRGQIEGAFHDRFSLYSRKPHPVGTIFSVLNEKEAESYIGKMVEFCDNKDFRGDGSWKKGTFEKIKNAESNYPFKMAKGDIYHLIRLVTKSFEEPKPKVDPGLITALKLSVQQWKIMHDTGKDKTAVYRFLGGESAMSCFLCDSAGRTKDGGTEHCNKCINWKASYCYQNNNSPFYVWREDQCTKNILLVLNHLKSELVRLESLSK